jgi:dsRNA-specific ribonuclease
MSIQLDKLYTEGEFTISDKYLSRKKKVIEQSIEEGKVYDIDILEFKRFIATILQKYGGLSDSSVDKYTNADNLQLLMTSLTHWSYDLIENYELLEVLGDATLNTVIVWYYIKIFPELNRMNKERATYLMSKLKTKGIEKAQFSNFCELLGLDRFIRYRELHFIETTKTFTIEKMVLKDRSMKEDVFEAFFGAINSIVNREEGNQLGYVLVSQIMDKFLDEIDMKSKLSLDPRDLEEGISMLKEIFDILKFKINSNNKIVVEQISEREKNKQPKFRLTLHLFLKSNGFRETTQSFEQEGTKKSDVEEALSREALKWLEQKYRMRWDYRNIVIPYDV